MNGECNAEEERNVRDIALQTRSLSLYQVKFQTAQEILQEAYAQKKNSSSLHLEHQQITRDEQKIKPGFLQKIGSRVIQLQVLFDKLPLKNISLFSYTADVTVTTTRIVITVHF